jgi:MFS family permease
MLALALLIVSTNIYMYIAAMVVMGLGAGFAASAGAIVGDVIKGKSGKVYAFWQMSGDAGMMVGPVLLGFVSDHFSYRAAIGVSAAVFSLAILAAIRIPETNASRLGDSQKPQLNEA